MGRYLKYFGVLVLFGVLACSIEQAVAYLRSLYASTFDHRVPILVSLAGWMVVGLFLGNWSLARESKREGLWQLNKAMLGSVAVPLLAVLLLFGLALHGVKLPPLVQEFLLALLRYELFPYLALGLGFALTASLVKEPLA